MFSALWAVFGHWQVLVGIVVLALLGVAYMYVKPFADILAKLASMLLDFARTRLGQITIVSVCVAAGVTGGLLYIRHQAYAAGYAAAAAEAKAAADKLAAEAEAALQKRREQIAALVVQNVDAAAAAEERARKRESERAENARVIVKEIPRYVTPAADSRCVVPVGFVLIDDAARTGLPPAAPAAGQSVDDPSAVTLSDIERNRAEVASLYSACRNQVAETVAWYEGVRTRYATMKGSE